MSSPKTPAKTTQVNETKLSPEQQQIYDLAFPFAQQYAQNPAQPYSGQTIAEFNPSELMAQQLAITQAMGGGQATGNAANTASQFLLDPSILSPDSNPWLAQSGQAITDRMTSNLTENILPTIRSGSSVTGGLYSGGNTREGIAQGLAIGKTNDALGSSLASLYGDAYKAGLSSMGDAVRSSPIAQSAGLFGAQTMGQVGAQQRALEQAKLDEAANQWNIQQMLPFMTASDLIGMVTGMPGGQGVSTVTGAQPKANPALGALGGAASGAALGSMVPGIGTGIGAAGGLLLGLLGGF